MSIVSRTPYQLGYAVADLPAAARHWASSVGAGPFLCIGEAAFDTVAMFGRACTFRHTPAFGRWGDLIIELQEVHECTPAALTQRFIPGPMPVLNHIAFMAEHPVEESARLSASGLEMFMHATMSDIEIRFHDARHTIGCAIEIHRRSAFLDAFNVKVMEAAVGWDGSAPLRPMSRS